MRPRTTSNRTPWWELVLFVLACVLAGRAVVQQSDSNSLDLPQYIRGHFAMPFQGRYLMVPVLRWANDNATLQHAAARFNQSTRNSMELFEQLLDAVCLCVLGGLVTRVRNRLQPEMLFPWLARWLFLWVYIVTVNVRFEARFHYAYDLLSAVFFAVGIVASLDRNWLLLLATIAVGAYNRETIVFVLPIWLLAQPLGRWKRSVPVAVAGLALYLAARLQVKHWLGDQPPGWYFTFHQNLRNLLPHHLPQVFSIGGFLAIPLLLHRRLVEDERLRRLWLGATPFLLAALVVGEWNETRIFNEVSLLVAVTAAIEFETMLTRHGFRREIAA